MTIREYLKHLQVNARGWFSDFSLQVEVDKSLQRARESQYQISIKPGSNLTKPTEFEAIPDDQWGDPVNYRFPISETTWEFAVEAYNLDATRSLCGYSKEEWEMVGETIAKCISHYDSSNDTEWTYDEYGRLVKRDSTSYYHYTDDYEYNGAPENVAVVGDNDYEALGADPDEMISIVEDGHAPGSGQNSNGHAEIAVVSDISDVAQEAVEVTANTIRIRQRNPADFQSGSFRTIKVTAGVKAVIGKLKGKSATTIQSLVFDKKKYNKAKAKEWAKNHGYRSEASEPDVTIDLQVEDQPVITYEQYVQSPASHPNFVCEKLGVIARETKAGKSYQDLVSLSGKILIVQESTLDDLEEGELEFITPLILIDKETGNKNIYTRKCAENLQKSIRALYESADRNVLKGHLAEATIAEANGQGLDKRTSKLDILTGRYFAWPSFAEAFVEDADKIGMNGSYANDGRSPDMYTSHEDRFNNDQLKKCGYIRDIFIEGDVAYLRARTMNTTAGRDMAVLINKNQVTGVSLVGWATETTKTEEGTKIVDKLHMLGTDFTDYPGMPFKADHAYDGDTAIGLFNVTTN